MLQALFLLLSFGSLILCEDPVSLEIKAIQEQRSVNIFNSCLELFSETENDIVLKNNDEDLFNADRRASFAKTLMWDSEKFHKVEFDKMVKAFNDHDINAFESLIGGAAPDFQLLRLSNPLATFAHRLDNVNSWRYSIAVPPEIRSAEAAGEMVELYWMSLLRDEPFNTYGINLDPDGVQEKAIAGINKLSDFKGPREKDVVTSQTLFRGGFSGGNTGPYISQFLYLPIPEGPAKNYDGSGSGIFENPLYQEFLVPTADKSNNFLTDLKEWERIQKGKIPLYATTYDQSRRFFLRTGRDLAEFVYDDSYVATAGIYAGLIISNFGLGVLDENFYYQKSSIQSGFLTFGKEFVFFLISTVTDLALKAAWFQKWYVHRKLRPEFFGYLVEVESSNPTELHKDLLEASVFNEPDFKNTRLLSQAYPEGCPVHPSYPSGHAAVGGAVATVLKAVFNEDFVIPDPVQPNASNDALEPYQGPALTVAGELNKYADNIAMGRCFAGVHYRSDSIQGVLLGEKVAIDFLNKLGLTYAENFAGFSLTKFDGTKITVGAKKTL